jgi:hypothetical protein
LPTRKNFHQFQKTYLKLEFFSPKLLPTHHTAPPASPAKPPSQASLPLLPSPQPALAMPKVSSARLAPKKTASANWIVDTEEKKKPAPSYIRVFKIDAKHYWAVDFTTEANFAKHLDDKFYALVTFQTKDSEARINPPLEGVFTPESDFSAFGVLHTLTTNLSPSKLFNVAEKNCWWNYSVSVCEQSESDTAPEEGPLVATSYVRVFKIDAQRDWENGGHLAVNFFSEQNFLKHYKDDFASLTKFLFPNITYQPNIQHPVARVFIVESNLSSFKNLKKMRTDLDPMQLYSVAICGFMDKYPFSVYETKKPSDCF